MNAPDLGQDEAALSSILGAILLFGLVVSTITTVQVQYVPVWDMKREGQLMDELSGEMMLLQADIAHQVGGEATVPLARPLTLAPPSGFSFFTGSTLPGTLSFQPYPTGTGVRLDAPQVTLEQAEDLHVLSETWQAVAAGAGGFVVPDVQRVDHLRLRILNPGPSLADDDHLTVRVIDADGDYAGKIVVLYEKVTSDYSMRVKVFAAGDEAIDAPITQVTEAWKRTTDQETYYVAGLNPNIGFSAVLAAAEKPMRLEVTTSMPTASVALVSTDAGTGQGSPSGITVSPFSYPVAGGRIVAERENQRFPQQRYILEHGALILEQPDGAAMVAAPDFAAHVDGPVTVVSFAVPEFNGVPDTVAGSRSARLASAPVGLRADLVLFASQLGFTLTTDHPEVWEAYFDEVLQDAGLRRGLGHYDFVPTADGLTVQLFGVAATSAQDVTVQFTDARLSVSLLASG